MTDSHVYTLGCKPGKATDPYLLLTVVKRRPNDNKPLYWDDDKPLYWRLQVDGLAIDLSSAQLMSPNQINKQLFRAMAKPGNPLGQLLAYRDRRDWGPVVGELMRAAGTI